MVLPFGPPNQNPVNTSPLHHACYMSRRLIVLTIFGEEYRHPTK